MLPIYTYLHPHLDKFPPVVSNPLASITAMLLLVYASKSVHVLVTFLLSGGYDNVSPRDATTTGKTWKDKMIARAAGAHQNSWEAFAAFAVAVLMAVSSEKEVPNLLALCNAFLWIRAAYIPVYVLAFNVPLSAIRSSTFMAGLCIVLKIMQDAAGW